MNQNSRRGRFALVLFSIMLVDCSTQNETRVDEMSTVATGSGEK